MRIGDVGGDCLVARLIATDPVVLCASPFYLAVNGQPERVEELSTHRLLMMGSGTHSDELTLPFQGNMQKVAGKIALRSNEPAVLAEAARLGAGSSWRQMVAAWCRYSEALGLASSTNARIGAAPGLCCGAVRGPAPGQRCEIQPETFVQAGDFALRLSSQSRRPVDPPGTLRQGLRLGRSDPLGSFCNRLGWPHARRCTPRRQP